MVFQKPNPFPKSIYENVAYGPRIHGLSANKSELDHIVQKSLKRAGLWDEVKDRLNESGDARRGSLDGSFSLRPSFVLSGGIVRSSSGCGSSPPTTEGRRPPPA